MLPFLAQTENKTLEVYEKATHGLTPEARAVWMPRTMTWHPSVIKYIISEAQAHSCDGLLGNLTLQKRLKVRPLHSRGYVSLYTYKAGVPLPSAAGR